MEKRKQINVALACVIDNQKILLTKREEKALPDIDNMWELPGGKVEFRESPIKTVIREVKEETGCDVADPVGLPFPYITIRQYNDYILHAIIFCFECKLVSKPKSFMLPQRKIADVQWFDIENINFMDIIAGSREFVSWVVKEKHGLNSYRIEDKDTINFQSYIHFECIKPLERSKKFYFINVGYEPNFLMNNKYTLSRFWGKITSKSRILSKYNSFINPSSNNVITEYFEDEFSLQNRIIQLANQRIRNGYKIVEYTYNIPIKEWLQQHKEYIEIPTVKATQLELDL
jgi:8-oxo-dGTP pyrophosphatase MutT (NUDIX family)/predicted DNA-binding WGR domain protein